MKMDLIKKLVDEIKNKEFREKHDVQMMSIGENGESTLHPEFLDILRLLKTTGLRIDLYTNFSVLNKELLRSIIDEDLIYMIHTNIDGSTPINYQIMKNIDYMSTVHNLIDFFEIRGNSPIKINIHSIPAINYIKAVSKHFGQYPHRMPDHDSLYEEIEIRTQWQPFLREDESIAFDDVLMWAERNHLPYIEGDYSCTQLGRVKHSVFIAPDGNYYACCLDVENRLTIGNLYESSINGLFMNDRHKELIAALENKEFEAIGSPCNRVDCCQVVCPYN